MTGIRCKEFRKLVSTPEGHTPAAAAGLEKVVVVYSRVRFREMIPFLSGKI
jgi:hypothetical protein